MDQKFEAMILSRLPWLPAFLKALAKEARRFDPKRPATALARVKGITDKLPFNSGVDQDRLKADLRQMYASPSIQQELRKFLREMPRAAKKGASANPSYSLLMKLISKADEQVPLVSLVILLNAADPTKNLRPQCEPLDLIEQAANSKGEARAKAVIRAYLEVAEWLYKPYLRRLWPFSCVITNDWRAVPEHFGNLVTQISHRLADYPGLVEGSAGWRRNAAAHSYWEYVAAEDALIMWDKNRAREKVGVEELFNQLNNMYQISGPTFGLVAQLYFFRDFLLSTGLGEALIVRIPLLLSSDEAGRTGAKHEMIKKAMEVFAPLVNYVAANSQAVAGHLLETR